MAKQNEHSKRQLPRDAVPHVQRENEKDTFKRPRLAVDSAAALRQPSRDPRPPSPRAVAVAAATTLPTSTASGGERFQRIAKAGSPAPPQTSAPPVWFATREPVTGVAAQLASTVAAFGAAAGAVSGLHGIPYSGAAATGVTMPGSGDEAPELRRFRATVVGSALVSLGGSWLRMRLGGKLHQRCTAASVHGRAAVVAELLGVWYQLRVERCQNEDAESGDTLPWDLIVPPVLPDVITPEAPAPTHITARLYVVQPPHLNERWHRRFGEPDGELSIEVLSELTRDEVETVANVLRSRSLDHDDTLRSIAGDVAAKLAGATVASAERGAGIHMDRECDQPHRNAQRRACEQMMAELRAMDKCEQRMFPCCNGAGRYAWRSYSGAGDFGLMDAAAAVGCIKVVKELRALGVSDARTSQFGTPAQLIVRLRGAMWDLAKQELCQQCGFWTTCAPCKSLPAQVASGSRDADGSMSDTAFTKVPGTTR